MEQLSPLDLPELCGIISQYLQFDDKKNFHCVSRAANKCEPETWIRCGSEDDTPDYEISSFRRLREFESKKIMLVSADGSVTCRGCDSRLQLVYFYTHRARRALGEHFVPRLVGDAHPVRFADDEIEYFSLLDGYNIKITYHPGKKYEVRSFKSPDRDDSDLEFAAKMLDRVLSHLKMFPGDKVRPRIQFGGPEYFMPANLCTELLWDLHDGGPIFVFYYGLFWAHQRAKYEALSSELVMRLADASTDTSEAFSAPASHSKEEPAPSV